jgi:hypothetical protein
MDIDESLHTPLQGHSWKEDKQDQFKRSQGQEASQIKQARFDMDKRQIKLDFSRIWRFAVPWEAPISVA